jgi:two-component system NarL family sensor kinase
MENKEDIEIFYFLLAGTLGMFLLSAAIVLFVILYQRRLHQHQSKLQEMEISFQKKLVQSNMEEVENERIRTSKDLHDEIGGIFSVLSIKIDQISSGLVQPSPDILKIIQESKQTIDHGIKSIRRISHNMIPPAMEMFGLVAALEDLSALFGGSPSALPIEFSTEGKIVEPNKKVSLVIFRIVQELLHNTLKHAQATKVEIILYGTDNLLILYYKDNGRGFNYEDRENRKGIGLLNIENRAQMLQATIHYHTEPEKGMEVVIKIPNQQTSLC